MARLTDVPLHLTLVGVILVALGGVNLLLPRMLRWKEQFGGLSTLNQEVSYVHCYFIGLSCVLWGLLPLTAGRALLQPNPVTRLVLVGAVAFWGSRLVIQLFVFNRHARDSASWRTLCVAATALWLYLTVIWACALITQL